MSETLYLSRTLIGIDRTYSEAELLSATKVIVVLAEPGAGKTDLLHSLARLLGTTPVSANKFALMGTASTGEPLVVDAFDELAKVDLSGIHKLLARAASAKPSHFVLSSRSSEWDTAATAAIEDYFGESPLLVRLQEFDEAEQQQIFEDYAPGEEFPQFQKELKRFDLEPLLPNPQFLKLFADAYVVNGRKFSNKKQIFIHAIERLAREANTTVTQPKDSISLAQKICCAEEVFAKLLLSGADGVSSNETSENTIYPTLTSLGINQSNANAILASRLFKPDGQEGLHRPVHKIVAEYAAANYFVKRIVDPLDPLTLEKCLPIIAPNSTVRDELRGLLAWMAALGNPAIQEIAIELDPYAVLANGDPSQLAEQCKSKLIRRLSVVAELDPHFRRGDFMRRFSVAGFFTPGTIKDLQSYLQPGVSYQLCGLILELLQGSSVVNDVRVELETLVTGKGESDIIRQLAAKRLLEIDGYDHVALAKLLLTEGSHSALRVCADIIASVGIGAVSRRFVADFLLACARLYPSHRAEHRGSVGSRYFVKLFINKVQLEDVTWLLDELSAHVSCTCGNKSYECDCRNGISKVVGLLMDQYFSSASAPFDPAQVWRWTENLNFHRQKSAEDSAAVRVLQNDRALRNGISSVVFGGLKDKNEIRDTRIHHFDFQSHSGLGLRSADWRYIADLAFETDNTELWASFISWHQRHRNKEEAGPDEYRRHLREQANQKPAFMREWAKAKRAEEDQAAEYARHDFGHSRRMRRYKRSQLDIHRSNTQYVRDNRPLVQSGRHWSLLVRFAELVLERPGDIVLEFGDEELARTALKNCLSFIAEQVPSLGRLAELQCASQGLYVENILYAACLEILRMDGSLSQVEPRILLALRTNIDMGYQAVSEEERRSLKGEVDRLVFPDAKSAEDYLREYVEPQLGCIDCLHPEVWQLGNDEVFAEMRDVLSLDWLDRFTHLAPYPLSELFEIAVASADRTKLQELIAKRFNDSLKDFRVSEKSDAVEQRMRFWSLRALFFLDEPPEDCWSYLKSNKDTVLALSEISGRTGRHDFKTWPTLSAAKVEMILDAFIDQWPKIFLPDSWGSGDPPGETAYRFLSELVWSIGHDGPDVSIPVLDRLLSDDRFVDFVPALKVLRASQSRAMALRDFAPPTPFEIVEMLDRDAVVTVEGLRATVLEELFNLQKVVNGGEFNTGRLFFESGQRLGEVRCAEIIAEQINLRLMPTGIIVAVEHQLKDANRCDITATKIIGGKRRLLVVEVKGQWHSEVFTAAKEQLDARYSIHPDADQQGIYLVLWFGDHEKKLAGLVNRSIGSAIELKKVINDGMPKDLQGRIDVFVFDLSGVKLSK